MYPQSLRKPKDKNLLCIEIFQLMKSWTLWSLEITNLLPHRIKRPKQFSQTFFSQTRAICTSITPLWSYKPLPPTFSLALAEDGIIDDGLGHFRSYSVFLGISHVHIMIVLFLFLKLIYLLLQRVLSQEPQKIKGKLFFLPSLERGTRNFKEIGS